LAPTTLPAPTDDIERAEHDLQTQLGYRTTGLGLVNGASPQ
jgi:hypothetical protein